MSQRSEMTLTPPDRVAILTVLEDPPEELEGLRAVLVAADDGPGGDGFGREAPRLPNPYGSRSCLVSPGRGSRRNGMWSSSSVCAART